MLEDDKVKHRVAVLEGNVQQLQEQINELAAALNKAQRQLAKPAR